VSRRKRLTAKQALERWDAYQGKCWRCGLPLDRHKRGSWHWGHIIARSCGGGDEPKNMAPECRECNEQDGWKVTTPLAAKIKRIRVRHIGAKPQTEWSKRYYATKEWIKRREQEKAGEDV
jgi:hypothetical protein